MVHQKTYKDSGFAVFTHQHLWWIYQWVLRNIHFIYPQFPSSANQSGATTDHHMNPHCGFAAKPVMVGFAVVQPHQLATFSKVLEAEWFSQCIKKMDRTWKCWIPKGWNIRLEHVPSSAPTVPLGHRAEVTGHKGEGLWSIEFHTAPCRREILMVSPRFPTMAPGPNGIGHGLLAIGHLFINPNKKPKKWMMESGEIPFRIVWSKTEKQWLWLGPLWLDSYKMGPPRYKLVYKPLSLSVTIVISTIKPLIRQLSYLGGPIL